MRRTMTGGIIRKRPELDPLAGMCTIDVAYQLLGLGEDTVFHLKKRYREELSSLAHLKPLDIADKIKERGLHRLANNVEAKEEEL